MNGDMAAENDYISATSSVLPTSGMDLSRLSGMMSSLNMQDPRGMQTLSARGDTSGRRESLSPDLKRSRFGNLESFPQGVSHSFTNQPLHSQHPRPLPEMPNYQPFISNCRMRYMRYLKWINMLQRKHLIDISCSISTIPNIEEEKAREMVENTDRIIRYFERLNREQIAALQKENPIPPLDTSRTPDPLSNMYGHVPFSNCKIRYENIRFQIYELIERGALGTSFVTISKKPNFAEMNIRNKGDETRDRSLSQCVEYPNDEVNHSVSPKMEERCDSNLEVLGEFHSCTQQQWHSSLPDPIPREHSFGINLTICKLRCNQLSYLIKELEKALSLRAQTACTNDWNFGEKTTCTGHKTPHQLVSTEVQSHQSKVRPKRRHDQISRVTNDLAKMNL